jgi:beta-lactamase regulating signal transducer with metallopeptidase domain
MALIIFAIQKMAKSRISKAWQYYIWLVVMFGLLFPFKPKLTLMNRLFTVLENNNVSLIQPENFRFSGVLGTVSMYIGIIWIGIAAVLLAKKLIAYQVYVCFIKKHQKEITPSSKRYSEIIAIYRETCDEMKVSRKIGLYTSEVIYSPMLIGFIRPAIILPNNMISIPEDLKYIFMHELSHYKRKDILYKWFIQIISCLHFFNPLMSMIKRSVNKTCELSCDERVIRKLNPCGKKAYGSALIRAAALSSVGLSSAEVYAVPNTISLMMCEEAQLIQERLYAIKGDEYNSALMIGTAVVLTSFIAFCTIHLGVFKNIFRTHACYCVENFLQIFTQL